MVLLKKDSIHAPVFEERSRPLAYSYEACEAALPQFACPYHYHSEVEVIAIHRSHGTCLVGGSPIRFSPGDVFLIGSMVPHSFMNRKRDSEGLEWTKYTVTQFETDILGDNLSGCPEFAPIRELLSTRVSLSLRGALRDSVHRSMVGLPDLSPSRGLLRVLDVLNAIATDRPQSHLLSGAGVEFEWEQHDSERLGRVFAYIHNHCSEELSLEAVAKSASMAPTSFSRYFHQKTGKTFQEHLAQVRVTEACTRLVLSDELVTNVCFASGFNNLSNFNRCFRRLTGDTPSAFRKKWKSGNGRNHGAEKPFSMPPKVLRETKSFRATEVG